MIHPHDIYSPAEPWTRRIKALAIELVKNGYKVRLVYFPLTVNDNLKPHFLDGYEVIPFSRFPSPIVFLKNTLKLIKLAKWADIVHFQKCHHYSAIPVVVAAYLNRKPLHYDWDDWEEMIWYESCGKNLHSLFIGFFFKILERFLPIIADTVSVSSKELRDLAIKFGVKEEDIYSTPVGADLEEFNPSIDGSQIRKQYNITTPLILYIGQLYGAQYLDIFIKAANIFYT
jgi:glycosyltransferase involved in cell wall biosynthesis